MLKETTAQPPPISIRVTKLTVPFSLVFSIWHFFP